MMAQQASPLTSFPARSCGSIVALRKVGGEQRGGVLPLPGSSVGGPDYLDVGVERLLLVTMLSLYITGFAATILAVALR